MTIYLTYPSMMKSDENCERRVRNNTKCQTPIGGVQAKLRFWEHVIYDPAGNRRRFPALPMLIRGAGNPKWDSMQLRAMSAYKADITAQRRRKKRQFLGAAALSFASANRISITKLRTQVNARLKSMADQMNIKFAADDARLLKIANRLNDLQKNSYINEERLNDVIVAMIKREETTQREIQWLQGEVSKTQQIQLGELNTLLHTVRDVRAMSMAELALDHMIIQQLTNATGKPIFERLKIYLMRIQKGILYLKHYAEKIEKYSLQSKKTKH